MKIMKLIIFLQQDLTNKQQTDESSLYYHTINFYGAQRIITQGIDLGKCNGRQDFGGTTVSYYLNDNFKYASTTIYKLMCYNCITHPPATLLEQHDHFNLSEDNKRWEQVVRRSRSGLSCEVDDYDSAYGPQATNDEKMLM